MARPRRAASSRSEGGATSESATTGSGELVCPECGRSFDRAAALGAHRRRSHGVAGSSRSTQRSTRGRSRSSATRSSTSTRGQATSGHSQGRAAAAASRGDRNRHVVDRDALLAALFPAGIPPREDVIRAVNNWLDEAERLARSQK